MPAKKAKKTKLAKKAKKEPKDKKAKETIKVKGVKPAPTKIEDDSSSDAITPEEKEDKASDEVTTEDKTKEEKGVNDVLDFSKPLISKEDKPEDLSTSLETEKLDDQQSKKITSFRQLDSDVKTEKESKFGSEPKDASSKKEAKTAVLTDIKKDMSVESEPEKTPEKEEEATGKKEKMSSDEVKKWLQDVRPDTSKESEKKSKPNFKLIFTIAVILLLFGVLIGGVFYYKSNVEDADTENEEETSETTTVSSPTPTQTPAPEEEEEESELDLSKYSSNVLNGSGIAGEAGKVAKLLEDAGFSSPTAGNAGSYDYTTTIISLKENVPDEVYEKIKESLETDYMVEKSDEKLSEDSDYDIKITVGSKKAE